MEDAMVLRSLRQPISIFYLLFLALILTWSSTPPSVKAASPVYMRVLGDDVLCDGTVNEDYPGTVTGHCAFQNFGKAHDEVDEGGVIYVGTGVYSDLFSIGKSVTVIGAGVDQTIIDRGGNPLGIQITLDPSQTVIISDLTVQNGISSGMGGGISISNGTVTLRDCVVQNNTAVNGGGIDNWGTLIIERCAIQGNVATTGGGGGIRNVGNLTIIESRIVDNHAGNAFASGGGIWNDNDLGEAVILDRVELSENTANTNGSAYYDQGDGQTTIVNSTVARNTVLVGKGSIWQKGPMMILNSTIAENFTEGTGAEGGLIAVGTVIIGNTIIANNDNADCLTTGGGYISSTGHNIESGTTCSFTFLNDFQNTDPLLGALGNYGGLTHTMALLLGSQAISFGNYSMCTSPPVNAVDQRGVTRPIGFACDIGAYEADYRLFLPLIMR